MGRPARAGPRTPHRRRCHLPGDVPLPLGRPTLILGHAQWKMWPHISCQTWAWALTEVRRLSWPGPFIMVAPELVAMAVAQTAPCAVLLHASHHLLGHEDADQMDVCCALADHAGATTAARLAAAADGTPTVLTIDIDASALQALIHVLYAASMDVDIVCLTARPSGPGPAQGTSLALQAHAK